METFQTFLLEVRDEEAEVQTTGVLSFLRRLLFGYRRVVTTPPTAKEEKEWQQDSF